LPAFLDEVIGDSIGAAIKPVHADVAGFDRYFESYTRNLPIEAAAVTCMQERSS
jgi:hypothetical protein